MREVGVVVGCGRGGRHRQRRRTKARKRRADKRPSLVLDAGTDIGSRRDGGRGVLVTGVVVGVSDRRKIGVGVGVGVGDSSEGCVVVSDDSGDGSGRFVDQSVDKQKWRCSTMKVLTTMMG